MPKDVLNNAQKALLRRLQNIVARLIDSECAITEEDCDGLINSVKDFKKSSGFISTKRELPESSPTGESGQQSDLLGEGWVWPKKKREPKIVLRTESYVASEVWVSGHSDESASITIRFPGCSRALRADVIGREQASMSEHMLRPNARRIRNIPIQMDKMSTGSNQPRIHWDALRGRIMEG